MLRFRQFLIYFFKIVNNSSNKPNLRFIWQGLKTLHTHAFRWFVIGKIVEGAGKHTNTSILKNLGTSVSIPSSYLLAQKCRITFAPILDFSMPVHAFLIAISPYETLKELYNEENTTKNYKKSSIKAAEWKMRHLIEFSLKSAIPEEFHKIKYIPWSLIKIVPLIGILGNEPLHIIKILSRESFEQIMLGIWQEECSDLPRQTPYLLANILYPYTLNPAVQYLDQQYNNITGNLYAIEHP